MVYRLAKITNAGGAEPSSNKVFSRLSPPEVEEDLGLCSTAERLVDQQLPNHWSFRRLAWFGRARQILKDSRWTVQDVAQPTKMLLHGSVEGPKGWASATIWNSRARQAGFTLVELLVVITIIGILMSLLLPAVQNIREAARRIECSNNLKQIGLAVHNYATAHSSFPPGGVHTDTSNSAQSHRGNWALAILPQLEQQNLFDRYDQTLHNTHENNLPVLRTLLPVMICGSDPGTGELNSATQVTEAGPIAPGSYKGVMGRRWGSQNGYFDYPPFANNQGRTATLRGPLHAVGIGSFGSVQFSNIRDGSSNTLLVGEYHTETMDKKAFWGSTHSFHNLGCPQVESYTRIPDYQRCYDINGGMFWQCHRAFGSMHSGGTINSVLCDGSVQGVNPNIDGQIFEGLATIAGGEIVQLQ